MSSVLLCGLLFIASCAKKQKYPSYGVKSVEVRMDPDHVGELFRSATQKVPYPATLVMDGADHLIFVEPAGDSTIREPKKSFNLVYDDGGTYQKADEVRMATTIQDPSMLRTILSIEVFKTVGIPVSHIEPAFFYMNDLTLGFYWLIERMNGDFFKNHKIKYDRYYSTEENADFSPEMNLRLDSAFSGSPKPANLEAMRRLSEITQLSSDAEFESKVFEMLDRETVTLYLTAALITNHYDGFIKNLYFVQPQGETKLKLAAWDFDYDWRPDKQPTLSPWASSYLFTRIAKIPAMHTEVLTRAKGFIAGTTSYAVLSAKVDAWKSEVQDAYLHDPILGGMGKSLDQETASLKQVMQDWFAQINAAI